MGEDPLFLFSALPICKDGSFRSLAFFWSSEGGEATFEFIVMILPREIEEIRSQVREKIAESGADLLEIQYRRIGPRGVITFIVDKEGGVTLENCVAINQKLGAYFDDISAPLIQGPYTLEVSSPGLDRLLVTERDFERTAGQTLRLTRRQASGAVTTQIGKMLGVKDGTLVFELEGSGEKLELPFSNVVKAVREIRFKK